MHVEYEMYLCPECTILVVNGDGSGLPDGDEGRRHDAALAVWGDDLRKIVMACGGEDEHVDCEGFHIFQCGYCRDVVANERHSFAILKEG